MHDRMKAWGITLKEDLKVDKVTNLDVESRFGTSLNDDRT